MSAVRKWFILLPIALVAAFLLSLCIGSVSIPLRQLIAILLGHETENYSWQYIVLQSRLPQALTALVCGAALAETGLLLQTTFHNALAGPGIFGISGGAGLGAALVMLALGGTLQISEFTFTGYTAILIGALAGAMAVMLLILFLARYVGRSVMLLIIGIMISYLTSSFISLLNFSATEDGVKSYMIWGMGNFSGVSLSMVPLFALPCLVLFAASAFLVKPLNLLLLGSRYAQNLGCNVKWVRNTVILLASLLTALCTAFCGPITFIGLAVPHLARMLLSTDNHKYVLPSTMLLGAFVTLLCNMACYLPGDGKMLPLNVITPLIGAPVVIYVIIKNNFK